MRKAALHSAKACQPLADVRIRNTERMRQSNCSRRIGHVVQTRHWQHQIFQLSYLVPAAIMNDHGEDGLATLGGDISKANI